MREATVKVQNAVKKVGERNLWEKLREYTSEVRFCLNKGGGLDKVRLSWNTIRYHFGNLLSEHLVSRTRTRRSPAIDFNIRVCGRPHHIKLRIADGDFFILHEIFGTQPYWIPLTHVREEAQTVVDLGANIGMTTLYLHEWLPRADFLCVEANPHNVRLLRENTSQVDARIDIVEGAISNRSGTEWFETQGPAWGTALTRRDAEGSVEVDAYSMSDLMEVHGIEHIDILKVDIEGAEKKIMRDGADWLDKVGWMMIELHDYVLEDFAADVEPYGFYVYQPASELGNKGAVTAVNTQYHDVDTDAAING